MNLRLLLPIFALLASPLFAEEMILNSDDFSITAPETWEPVPLDEESKVKARQNNETLWQPKTGLGTVIISVDKVPFPDDAHQGLFDILAQNFDQNGIRLEVNGRMDGPTYTYCIGGRWVTPEFDMDKATMTLATDNEILTLNWTAQHGVYPDSMATLIYLLDYISVRSGAFTKTKGLPEITVEIDDPEAASAESKSDGEKKSGSSLFIPILIGVILLAAILLFLMRGKKKA